MDQKLANGIAGFIGAGLTFLARAYLSNSNSRLGRVDIVFGIGSSVVGGLSAAAATSKNTDGDDPKTINKFDLAMSALGGSGIGYVGSKLADRYRMPTNGLDSTFSNFEINHRETPGGRIISETGLDSGETVKVVYNPSTGTTATIVTSKEGEIKVVTKEGERKKCTPDNNTGITDINDIVKNLTKFMAVKSSHNH